MSVLVQGVYLVLGGVPGPGGCTWSGGVGVPGLGGVPGPEGCTWSWGVYLVPGGGCTWSWGMYLVPGGVYLPGAGGGGYLLGGCTCPCTPPPPPWTEWQVQNITLPQTSFAGGNNNLAFRVYSQLASKSHRFFLPFKNRWNAFLWCCLQITLKVPLTQTVSVNGPSFVQPQLPKLYLAECL